MVGNISIIQLAIAILLFIVIFFGIGFLLNMILRSTWVMACIYPLVVIWIVGEYRMIDYIFKPKSAWEDLGQQFLSLHTSDIILLTSGLIGAVIAGLAIKSLRKAGYQMF